MGASRGPYRKLTVKKIDEVIALAATSIGTPSYAELSKASKVSQEQVIRIMRKHEGVLQALRSQTLPPLLDRLAAGRDLVLAAVMDPAKLEKASLKDASIALGIVSDKYHLEAGRPTQHVAVIIRHDVEALDKLADVLSRALVEVKKSSDVIDL